MEYMRVTAATMLSNYYDPSQLEKVLINRNWYNNVLTNGQDIRSLMYDNQVKQTQAFGITSDFIKIGKKDTDNPYYLVEDHPALDFGRGGSVIRTPGGYWAFEGINGNNAMLQLYGGDVRMRINHLNTAEITYTAGQILGTGSSPGTIFNYPAVLYGTGDGPHTYTEYTRNLPYNGAYRRQFVNPNTFIPSPNYFEYQLRDYTKEKDLIETRNYWRNF
jgi:hypothetical protein